MLHTMRTLAGLLRCVTSTASAQSTQPVVRTVAHPWKPVRAGGADVVAIEVRTELRGFAPADGRALSRKVPITYAGVLGIAASFRDYWYGASRNFSADSIRRIGFNDEAVRTVRTGRA